MTESSQPSVQPSVVEAATRGIRSIPFVERAGLEVLEVAPGRCVLRAPAEPNVNHFGTMYAGALYTLGEVPGGVLFFATFDGERYFPLVTGSAIRYLKPARGDITVEATIAPDEVTRLTAEVEERGKASWDLDLELRDDEGDVVATVSSHYQMRPVGSLT